MTNPDHHVHDRSTCAWCIHRDGDLCIHPNSHVYGQECGPVCIGATHCHVRENLHTQNMSAPENADTDNHAR